MTLYVNKKVLQRRRARKPFSCHQCRQQINPGEDYYSITYGGGGLGDQKYPDRIHLKCIDAYFGEEKEVINNE